MKIKWGALVVDGRGKLGGHVASKNRGGAFLRTKVTPVNPSTMAQTLVRSIFAVISTGWSLLTNAQRATWNNAVDDFANTDIFGDIKKPSGKNLHQKLNQNLLLVGESILTSAPAKLAFPDAVVTSGTLAITAGTATYVGLPTSAGVFISLGSTGTLSDGTTNAKNRFRNIFNYEADAIISTAVIYTAYVARFGVPSVGDNIQLSVSYTLASGQKSPMQIINATIDA